MIIDHRDHHVDPESRRVSDSSRILLDSFAERERSLVANIFCHAARAGAQTPAAVLAAVRSDVEHRIRSAPYQRDQMVRLRNLLDTDDAQAFARWVLTWEALSFAEKDRIKQQRGAEHRQRWMATQPPTERQVKYLRVLGYQGEVESKAQASELIDRLLRSRGGAA